MQLATITLIVFLVQVQAVLGQVGKFNTRRVMFQELRNQILPSRAEALATTIIVASSPIIGAGLGALIAKLNKEDVKKGAAEGAGVGASLGVLHTAVRFVPRWTGNLIGNAAGAAVGTIGARRYADSHISSLTASANEHVQVSRNEMALMNEFKAKAIKKGTAVGGVAGSVGALVGLLAATIESAKKTRG